MSDEIQDLTLKIYVPLQTRGRWGAALDQLVDRVGAQGSIIFEWEDSEGDRRLTAPIHSGYYSSDAISVYLSKCQDMEARDQAIIRQHTHDDDEIALLDDTLLASSVDELKRQEHVQKLMRLGIFHRAAGVMNKDNRWLSLFSVQLNAARNPLDAKERHFLSQVLPHVAKALDLSIPIRQLQSRYQRVLSAIDELAIGVCVLDSRAMIVARNEEFRRQQETYRLFRVGQGGQLRIADRSGQSQLDRLMSDWREHGRFGGRPRKESILSHTDTPLCIEITPLQKSDEIGNGLFGGFVLCSTDTSLPVMCDKTRIRQAFGLTSAEASLVDAIGEGLTNPEIADCRNRSVSTVNAQTKSILAKSNCANRTQFVRMMMRFGASFLTPR
ncbi:helix-turn-helix transcriptional regulator [Roseibium album]|uniref:helix-turn-helix transcriptional regulator n=1 Tax=Roseibium album TaxID=311410 RepID=UPI0024911C8E|nr:helix-turn-helix transcriptional regulator [Roseibium album]